MTMKLSKNYWEERYQKGEIGWNVGNITTPIKEYIDQLTDKNIKILIPGVGNGYEFEYLIEKGFKNSFVVDYAETPLENLKKSNGRLFILGVGGSAANASHAVNDFRKLGTSNGVRVGLPFLPE